MTKHDSAASRAKRKEKRNPEHREPPLSIRVPVYACAAALVLLYGWGAIETYPPFFALALSGVFALAELLKPKLGELIGEALDLKAGRTTALLLVAALAAVGIGAFGAHGAMSAANKPVAAYTALAAAAATAQATLEEAQQRVDAVPTCTPDMPKVRCQQATESNASRLTDAVRLRDRADERANLAAAALANAPNPGQGIPQTVQDLAPVGAGLVEFLIFLVPLAWVFLARQREALSAPAAPPAKADKRKPAPKPKAGAELAKKGWDGEAGKARREALAARNRAAMRAV